LRENFTFPEWRSAVVDASPARYPSDADASGHRSDVRADVFTIIALTPPGLSRLSADRADRLSILANDRLADAVAVSPDRLAGLAQVPLRNPVFAAKELERAVTR
jgi:predicted TIM-barrel fold metal-dependent hydrolase